jgi:hypothetical protein
MSYIQTGMGSNGVVGSITGCPPDRGTINLSHGEGEQAIQAYQEAGCIQHTDMPNAWCCDGFVGGRGVTLPLSEMPRWVPFVVIGGIGLIAMLAIGIPAISGATGAYMAAPEGKKRHAAWRGAAIGLGSQFAAGAALHGTGLEHLAGAAPFAAGAYYGSQLSENEGK